MSTHVAPFIRRDGPPERAIVTRSGEAIWLENGLLRLGLVPVLGGRLLSLSTPDGPELLWRNEKLLSDDLEPRRAHQPHSGSLGDWLNYGGDKTWIAPQGWDRDDQWAGPPDPVLDSGPYAARVEEGPEAAAVILTSQDDPRTGLRLTRTFELASGACGYRLKLRAVNTSDRSVRWALWNITQLPADGEGGTYVAGPPQVAELIAGTGTLTWQVNGAGVHVPHQDVVGKLGFPAATGQLSHTGQGRTLTLSFFVDAGGEYPDSGSRVEVWMEHPLPAPLAELGQLDPPARIVECEVLGPLTTLAPGEAIGLSIDYLVEDEEANL